MPLPKLDLAPEANRYSVLAGAAVISKEVAGGRSRPRRDQLGAPLTASVSWSCSVGEYAYLGAFYRSLVNHGSEPFLIDLVTGYAAPSTHEARFVPGSFALSAISGLTHTCTATLEVKALDRDPVADAALVALYAPAVGGLQVMALTPSLAGYGVQRGPTVLRTQPGLGPSAMRLDRFNTPSRMAVTWNVGPQDFDYLNAFYFTAIAEGALPFLIESVHDHPDPRQLKALVAPGGFGLQSIQGMTYSVRAEVEVVPILSPDYDTGVLTLYGEFGEEWPDFLDALDRLVVLDMPSWD